MKKKAFSDDYELWSLLRLAKIPANPIIANAVTDVGSGIEVGVAVIFSSPPLPLPPELPLPLPPVPQLSLPQPQPGPERMPPLNQYH
ncbi:hypothetical protein, partial [Crocosphaera sp.]|uniref:hypothetical protein n=1 Tax=Crocosphaera sp. TaxID=2729996 RepID=UPI00339070E6